MNRFTFGTLLLAVGCIVCLAGCQTENQLFVQRDWSQSLRELGIVPIFPPREDLVVGDVYATAYNPSAPNVRRIFETRWEKLNPDEQTLRLQIGLNSRLARLPLNDLIEDEYSDTLAAPATSPDYNSILGNPALIAADEQIEKALLALSALQKKVKDAKDLVTIAEKTLLEKQRAKASADLAVTQADEDLKRAKSNPPNVKEELAALETAKTKQRQAIIAVSEAQYQLDLATIGNLPDEIAKSKSTLALRNRERAAADLEVSEKQAALDAKKAKGPDVGALETAAEKAIQEQRKAAQAVTNATADKDNTVANANTVQTESAKNIEAAEQEVNKAKANRTAIFAVGVKTLYPQPRDAKRRVYSADDLLYPKLGGDDLTNARVNRLRLVGFPEFTTASFSQQDLAALIPIEAMSAGLNVSATNVEKVTVKVPAAESYSISIDHFYKNFLVAIGPNEKNKWKAALGKPMMEAIKDEEKRQIQINDNISNEKKNDAKTANKQGEDPQVKIETLTRKLNESKARLAQLTTATEQLELASRQWTWKWQDKADDSTKAAAKEADRAVKTAQKLAAELESDAHAAEKTSRDAALKAAKSKVAASAPDATEAVLKAAKRAEEAASFAKTQAGMAREAANDASLSVAVKHAATKGPKVRRATYNTDQLLWQSAQFQVAQRLDPKQKSGDEHYYYLRVITEVYYARALDISMFSANAFGARAQANLLVPTAGVAPSTTGSEAQVTSPAAPINSSMLGTPTGDASLRIRADSIPQFPLG